MTNQPVKREYLEHPIASVAVCVLKGKRVMVIKRATPPSQGLWSVPGGVIELGETIQEAARREIARSAALRLRWVSSLTWRT